MMRFAYILLFCSSIVHAQNFFIRSHNAEFIRNVKTYSYLGTNYWYGGYLAHDTTHGGYHRLCHELDFLKKHGVSNLRVLFSGEGDDSYPYRISPSVQPSQRVYDEKILRSFDIFLHEVSKRDMTVVVVLNNNWEWSGGFGQYLEWAGYPQPILPKTANWDWNRYCEYITQFYTCDSCQLWYRAWIEKLIYRQNTISQRHYKNDPTIMAWQLANEPRPMKPHNKWAYKKWIKETSEYIKSIDSQHMVSIGVEGLVGTAMDTPLYLEIHEYSSIDYATIHLWPKTWQWYNGEPHHATSDTTLEKTKSYIQWHARLAKKLKKPLVIEEFGLHRDGNSYLPAAATHHRNLYYEYILIQGNKEKVAGYNFWGAIAYRDISIINDFWKKGMPYTADPPQEEQGLYGVFMTDTATWKLIKKFNP